MAVSVKPKMFAVGLWAVPNIFALIYTIYIPFSGGEEELRGELYAIPFYILFVVNLPISLLAGYLIALASQVSGYLGLAGLDYPFTAVVEWLVFFCFGYFQWFVLVPILLRKAKQYLRKAPSS